MSTKHYLKHEPFVKTIKQEKKKKSLTKPIKPEERYGILRLLNLEERKKEPVRSQETKERVLLCPQVEKERGPYKV